MEITWTAERVERLGQLFAEGLPTAEIGRRLGLTKNAVIGRLNRNAMTRRETAPKAPPRPNVFEFSGPSCLWPYGHPNDTNFHFCGARPVPGKPYCAEHAAVAYVRPRDQSSNAA